MAHFSAKTLAKGLKRRFKDDAYLQKVIDGALRVASDKKNPIRGNLCASAIRELITHVLHTLGPTERVTTSPWFKQEPNTTGPTRRQRATYIMQGGLSDKFVSEELGFEMTEINKDLKEAVDNLSKYTHLKEDSILFKKRDVFQFIDQSLSALTNLLDYTEEFRRDISSAIEDALSNEILSKFLEATVDELDELSTHTMIEGHEAEEISVRNIDDQFVTLTVKGTIYVTREYGSRSDFRNGDGVSVPDQYPYTAELKSSVASPLVPLSETAIIRVDNTSFYE